MSDSITILDSRGIVKYRVTTNNGMKSVFAANGKFIGSIRNGKTFDATGRLVSHGEDVSALTLGEN